MAGPRFLNTGGVTDPYQNLQQAVSGVGRIYQDYDENQRRQAAADAQEQERNRIKSMREFASTYDSRVGDDYRGINAGLRPLVEQSEAQARKQFQATNPQATAEQASAFESQLLNARRSLASAEDVANTVTNDYLRAGFSPEEAQAYGANAASGFGARGSALAQAQAEADARNKSADQMSERLLELYKARSASDNAAIRALGSSSSGGGGRTGGTGKTMGGGGALLDPESITKLTDYTSSQIGGLIDFDTPEVMQNFSMGLDAYNAKARASGGRQLSFAEGQSQLISNLSKGKFDNDAKFESPEEFETLLSAQYGPPDASNRQGMVGGAGGGVDHQSLVAGMRSGLSEAERQAILSPSRVTVNPQQVMRQQVASAYASLFPQAAAQNRPIVEQAMRPTQAPAPSRAVAAPSSGGDRPRYQITPAGVLAEGQTRGTGFTQLTPSGAKEAPADATSSPVSRTSTMARELAGYQVGNEASPELLRRVDLTLGLLPEDERNQVRSEMNQLLRQQQARDDAQGAVASQLLEADALERSIAGVNPESLSTRRERLTSGDPYGLMGQTAPSQLENYVETVNKIRQLRLNAERTNQSLPDAVNLEAVPEERIRKLVQEINQRK
jgi:hypothetical protein